MSRIVNHRPLAKIAAFAVLSALAAACATSTDDDEVEGNDSALTSPECGKKAEKKKTSILAQCTKDREAATAELKRCTGAAAAEFQAYEDRVNAALAAADPIAKKKSGDCFAAERCAASKALETTASTGWRCSIANFWASATSFLSTCNEISVETLPGPEGEAYRQLIAELDQRADAFTKANQECISANVKSDRKHLECTTGAEKDYKKVYAECRQECPVKQKGAACIPEGETVECGVAKDVGFFDEGCECKATSACSVYKKLKSDLEAAEQAEIAAGNGVTTCQTPEKEVGRWTATLKFDAKGAPTGAVKTCKKIEATPPPATSRPTSGGR